MRLKFQAIFQPKVAIEQELIFMNKGTKEVRSKINETPSIGFVQDELKIKYPEILSKTSREQASCLLEVKSKPQKSLELAYEETQEVIRLINDKILNTHEVELQAQSVPTQDFEVVPASLDPQSRSFQLFNEWGAHNISKTVICSTQLNIDIDMPFFSSPRDTIERIRFILNQLSSHKREITEFNSGLTNQNGKTREDLLKELMRDAKGKHFDSVDEILVPPFFNTNQEMFKWMLSHSGESINIGSLSDYDILRRISPKDMHGYLAKIKFNNLDPFNSKWVLELRSLDSTSDFNKIKDFLEFCISITHLN